MLMIPVVYEKYDKFVRLARALKEVRIGFILTGMGATLSLLIASVIILHFPPLIVLQILLDLSSLSQRGHRQGAKMRKTTLMLKATGRISSMPFQDGVIPRKLEPSFSG